MTDATETYCLRPDVVVEPVVAGWYATTQLVSPLAHAMNTAFRHIPIMDGGGGLVGLVSQRDILAASGSSLFAEAGESEAESYVALSAVMTETVQTIDSHASVRGTAMYLQQHKLGCLPVVDDGQLTGIVTDSDFVAVAINLLEQAEMGEPEELDLD